MASENITINEPVLIAGQKFKTRYRLLPAGAWSSYVDRTNAQFTLTGLSAGTYELEIILVLADETECPAIIRTFKIVDTYTCGDFAVTMANNASVYYLQVSFSIPSPFVQPPCGWDIIYTQNNVSTTVHYASLPTSGLVNINIPANVSTQVTIKGNICNGGSITCYSNTIAPIVPPCTPLVITSKELVYNGPLSSLPNTYFIRIQVINSSPTTPNYIVSYQETSQTGSSPADNGSFTYTGATLLAPLTPFLFSIQVHPNGLYKPYELSYVGSIVDVCGISHPFNVSGT